jgi:MYXO-CTERM domain-containing protein
VQLLVTSDAVKAGEVASVNISAPELLAGEQVALEFETLDGSAVAGTDFEGALGKVTVTPEASATITVQTSESAGSSAPELSSLQFYVRITPQEGARAVLRPPLATVGVQVEPSGEGGAPGAGNGNAGAPGAGNSNAAGAPSAGNGNNAGAPNAGAGASDADAGDGGAAEVEGRAASRDDGGCACVVGRRAPARALYGVLALGLGLVWRRRRRLAVSWATGRVA